jgi:hypothetical protein
VALTLQQQQQQIYKLEAELADLRKERSRLRSASKGGLLKKPDLTSTAGLQILENLASTTNLIKTKQKELKALNKTLDEAKSDSEVVSEVGSADEARKAAEAGYGPDQIQQYRDDLATQLKDKKDKKKAEKAAKKGQTQDRDLTLELANAGPFVYQTLDGPGRKDLAAQLNAIYGDTNLPISELPSTALKNAYTRLLLDRFQRSLDEGKDLSVIEFMELATVEGTYRNTGGAGEPDIFASISDPTQAASIITSVFKSELNRDPTATELAKYTKRLQSAERRNPFKTVDGIRTGGLDKAQFIVGELQKLPEYSTKKADTRSLTVQTLQSTANANGVSLSPQQLEQYALEVQNGKDIKVIQSQIRNVAGAGMPDRVVKLLAEGTDLDTVYAPYRGVMSAILELNPDSISLNDPTLRSAIGSNGETSIYDFQRALRKDARWQYTNNAREDVFQSVGKVLQDFGFQG